MSTFPSAKRQSAPISKADLTTIRQQFAVSGRVQVIPWAPHYAVSDCARVFSCRGSSGDRIREIKATVDSEGYHSVSIIAPDGKRRNVRLHKLVAEAFVANTSGGRLVLHDDGNPRNNAASNLKWGTHADNIADSRRHGTLPLGSKLPHAKVKEIDVVLLRLLKLQGWPITEVAAAMGYKPDYAAVIARGGYWQTLPACDELLAKVLAALNLEIQPEQAVPKSGQQKPKKAAAKAEVALAA